MPILRKTNPKITTYCDDDEMEKKTKKDRKKINQEKYFLRPLKENPLIMKGQKRPSAFPQCEKLTNTQCETEEKTTLPGRNFPRYNADFFAFLAPSFFGSLLFLVFAGFGSSLGTMISDSTSSTVITGGSLSTSVGSEATTNSGSGATS